MPAGKRAFLQGVAFWGVVLGLCYLGLRYALPCFLPLVLGAIMAAALHPAAAGLCRRLGWRYRPCAVLVAVAALTLLGLLLWGIGGVVVRQGSALLPQIPAFYRETLLPLAEELREKWQTLQQGRAGGGWGTSLEEVLQNAVTSLSRRVVGWLGGIASSLPSILFTLTFTVLSTIFFLQDYAGITGFIVRSLPGRWLRPMVESKRYLLGAVQKVLFAYLCIMFITFGEITLGLWLLRVPYFAAIAFAIALLDILPFIGSGLFLIPWGAYHLLISAGGGTAAALRGGDGGADVAGAADRGRADRAAPAGDPDGDVCRTEDFWVLGAAAGPAGDDAAAASAAGRLPAGGGVGPFLFGWGGAESWPRAPRWPPEAARPRGRGAAPRFPRRNAAGRGARKVRRALVGEEAEARLRWGRDREKPPRIGWKAEAQPLDSL